MPDEVRVYCERCDEPRPIQEIDLQRDALNPKPWGDIVCPVCHFVIATLSADRPGRYRLVRLETTND